MKISEKQIMQLIYFVQQYRHSLLKSELTPCGENELKTLNLIVADIINQQSEQLRDIKDE
jgi:hypothetical protein